nr:hypothetical protein BaRGS_002562 [Batillaria attramentaria]
MEINIFAYFGAGIAMSSWSWTKASLSAWERFFRKVFRKPSSKPVKLKRHKMIAQAFERRRDVNNGHMSVSFHSTHDDPLGMKLDLHSVSSNMSNMSNFANNVPRLLRRRGGLVHPTAGTLRRYSDSDIASVMSRRLSQNSQQLNLHDGQFVYIERDGSSNNGGGSVGGWRRRRRRRRKRRKKRNAVQPILGPVLSGMGIPGMGPGVMRRGSDTSVLSKASAQGIRMHMEGQGFKLGGSLSSLPGNEHVLSVSDTGGRGLRMGGGSRRSRRKLPRLQPLKRSSSSRSSLSQLGLGYNHPHLGQFHHAPYPHLYGGYDYAAYYANMYPQLAYPPYWQPYAYPHPQYPPPPHAPTTDFSVFGANASSLPGATGSSPEMERRRVMMASTSRRSEVTVETQQTEFIPMQKMGKSAPDFKKPAPLSDDSIEDLNSSQLEDSGAETEGAETEVKV